MDTITPRCIQDINIAAGSIRGLGNTESPSSVLNVLAITMFNQITSKTAKTIKVARNA